MSTSAPTPEDIEFNLLESRLELVNSDKLSDTLVTPTTPVTEAPMDSEEVEVLTYAIDNWINYGTDSILALAEYLISLGYHR